MRLPALALAAFTLTVTLCGCQTSQEKSARLEREAKKLAAARPIAKGLSIGRQSSSIRVTATALVRGREGAAAVVTLRNSSARAITAIPIEITVRDARGAVLYENTAAGLTPSLTTVPLIAPHGETSWIDDQVPIAGTPASVTARVGEGVPSSGAIPLTTVAGTHLFEDPANGVGAEGDLTNHSSVPQRELIVYVLARRSGRIVAAGRAVLALAPAGAATHFQAFLIGSPAGATLQASAPPSTLR